ncbi:SGNH/GDSL hydrolase family protein [Arthrobacter jiangjiafuii]|uniref:SGNH/GDSL hydrolase family protein n=1 Tax=Arthrobacter jiangjiafuii TaxID=2817475 RepID=A0A975M4M0_9MICC|nr:SGNH/GDSL hydrolase family protein [Arthrobacter jiangjiafuii]MBP3044539.1 SGNH/GDSL hydrolase family protein [Arthrobacter jiangjiafuii]QWC09356.1 SGNH/GDSL hydrolase family protein [Arthrobacter jiangjiafuii]
MVFVKQLKAGSSALRRVALTLCAGILLVSGAGVGTGAEPASWDQPPSSQAPDRTPAGTGCRQALGGIERSSRVCAAVSVHGHGSLIRVPGLERMMTYDAAIARSAVVIGDSQTGPDTWVDRGLKELGFRTVLRGAGGTGYTVGNGTVGSYYTALVKEQWLLPYGNPKLVILQGGGNDAGRAADSEIAKAAAGLVREMRRTYPHSRLVMVGVISTKRTSAGIRRAEVDQVLAGVAAQEGVEFLSVGDWWDRYSLRPLLQPDGRHFTAAGHQAAGTVFATELGRLLEGAGPGPG